MTIASRFQLTTWRHIGNRVHSFGTNNIVGPGLSTTTSRDSMESNAGKKSPFSDELFLAELLLMCRHQTTRDTRTLDRSSNRPDLCLTLMTRAAWSESMLGRIGPKYTDVDCCMASHFDTARVRSPGQISPTQYGWKMSTNN